MKTFKKTLSLILSVVMVISIFTVMPVSAKPKFVKIAKGKVTTGEITEENKINYFKIKVKEKSKVSLLAYNGNLSEFYTLKCKIYKDKALTKRVFKTDLRVTDTDVWGPYKKLKAGTYYITLKSKDTFEYYIRCDMLPCKK